MFNRDYLEKLKLYVGKDIQLVESDNEVHIYLDSEIQYFLRKKEQKYILYVSERGKETEEKRYTSEVDMKRNFALWVKSNFSENIKYPFSGKFREVTSVEELRILMQQYADEKTYSINDPKEERINILKSEDGQYSIFFLDKNGKKYILEQETENPFVFKRFYNEVTYYGETMRQIREYEEVFEDKLEDDVKIQLLGY